MTLDLTDPGTLKAFLKRHGISAAKGLGQHFLCSRKVVEAISLRLQGMAGLLEIGPGPGVLTSVLSGSCERIVALEIDARMVEALRESAPRAEIVQGDALIADLSSILDGLRGPRGVVSNLPYYITGPLVTRIAEASAHWDVAVLMMQKEVATRIMAQPGDADRGSLSVYLQAQFEIERVCDVPAGSFLPPPKVESTVLEFRPNGQTFDTAFFELVRSGFKQPRKTLMNNLLARSFSRADSAKALALAGLDERVRPHALTLEQWIELARSLV